MSASSYEARSLRCRTTLPFEVQRLSLYRLGSGTVTAASVSVKPRHLIGVDVGCRPRAVGRHRPLWSTLRSVNREFSRPLVQSHQWKLWLAAVAVGLIAIAYIAPERVSAIVSLPPVTLELVATAAGLVTMLAVWASVRCPSCGLQLVWHAMSTKGASTWLSWLLQAKSCPKCGYNSSPVPEDE